MIIFLNGPINSGKTTLGRALANTLPNARFIDGDDHNVPWNGNLQEAIQAGQDFIARQIAQTPPDQTLIIAYPLGEESYQRQSGNCTNQGHAHAVITLAPPLKTALSNRGSRQLDEWERNRIIEMYEEGYTTRSFSNLFFDNSTLSVEACCANIAQWLDTRYPAR